MTTPASLDRREVATHGTRATFDDRTRTHAAHGSASSETSSGSQPAPLDAARTGELLLRVAISSAAEGVAARGAGREQALVVAVNHVIAALRELAQIVLLGPYPVRGPETLHALELGLVTSLAEQLKAFPDLSPLSAELTQAMQQVPFSWPRVAMDDQLPALGGALALSSEQDIDLARQSIVATETHLAQHEADDIRDEKTRGIVLCAPLAGHLNTAVDAALRVSNRRLRSQLKPDVERVSTRMDSLAELLSMAPRLDWNRAFASAFDAESSLRKALGLVPRPRPYSGQVDPTQAAKQMIAGAQGTSATGTDWSQLPFTDSAAAVSGVGEAASILVNAQSDAVRRLQSDLEEPPAPVEPSLVDTLIDLAVDAALGAAAGAVGTLVSKLINGKLEASAKRALLGQGLSEAEAKKVTADLSKTLGRAVALESGKNGSKDVFKDLVKLGIKQVPRDPAFNAAQPLHAFVQRQLGALDHVRKNMEFMYLHLSGALSQLGIDELNALKNELIAATTLATDAQYRSSLREWQNLKVRLQSAPQGPGHAPNPASHAAAHTRMPDVQLDRRCSGCLEVSVDIDSDPRHEHVNVAELRLVGGEPAAIRWYRTHPEPLQTVGLYQRYVLRSSAMPDLHHIVITVDTDHRVLEHNIDDASLQILKVYAAKEFVDARTAFAAVGGAFAHIADSEAIGMARRLVRYLGNVSTAKLEER